MTIFNNRWVAGRLQGDSQSVQPTGRRYEWHISKTYFQLSRIVIVCCRRLQQWPSLCLQVSGEADKRAAEAASAREEVLDFPSTLYKTWYLIPDFPSTVYKTWYIPTLDMEFLLCFQELVNPGGGALTSTRQNMLSRLAEGRRKASLPWSRRRHSIWK